MAFNKLIQFSPIFLRYSMALLFLWFGINQLLHAQMWVSWLPSWLGSLPIQATSFIYLNGTFETIFGFFLALGLFTRLSALLLSLHLFGIAFTIGYNDIGVRDFCLALGTMAVAFHGADRLSYDIKFRKSWWGHTSAAKLFYLYEKSDSSQESI